MRIEPSQLEQLFGDLKFDASEMLQQQISEAEAFSRSSAEFFKAVPSSISSEMDAKAHLDYADYTRRITGSLVPYVVETKVHNVNTGSFRVMLLDQELLDIRHISLGRRAGALNYVYLVVFVEKELKNVRVNASSAR